nr:transglycosylase SLT domain-containing protein [Streptomyces humicola]
MSFSVVKRLARTNVISVASVVAASAAALACTVVTVVPGPGSADGRIEDTAAVTSVKPTEAVHGVHHNVSKQADAAGRHAKNQSRPASRSYPDNLDGWIREALDIMHRKGIPGSYEGIRRNIMRESSGNPRAINDWDVNAKNGVPSKGLLQVIEPTFKRYHVAGTSNDLYDPVANITAACNYAAHRYGSMDNVNSAY